MARSLQSQEAETTMQEEPDDGRSLRAGNAAILHRGLGLRPRLREHLTGVGWPMNIEYLIGAILSVLLTVYLIYALLRPTRF